MRLDIKVIKFLLISTDVQHCDTPFCVLLSIQLQKNDTAELRLLIFIQSKIFWKAPELWQVLTDQVIHLLLQRTDLRAGFLGLDV